MLTQSNIGSHLGVSRPTDFDRSRMLNYLPVTKGWLVGTLSGAQLGDARTDIINGLAVVLGASKAQQVFAGFEKLVEEKARAGAAEGVKPYIYTALAIGGLGAVLGTVAFMRVRSMRKRK